MVLILSLTFDCDDYVFVLLNHHIGLRRVGTLCEIYESDGIGRDRLVAEI